LKHHQTPDYTILDNPDVSMRLFHPRTEAGTIGNDQSGRDLLIPVEKEIVVGARFYAAHPAAATILFFHGNGEIVADYNDLGPVYSRMGINFLPVDYRGYGRSTGQPSVSSMMHDCHVILHFVKKFLIDQGHSGPLVIMGRSLGSASALELASAYKDDIDGLIIESGFALAEPLLRLLGIDPPGLGFSEDKGFRNVDKIQTFEGPTLIIHAEYDHIIPFSDGQALYDSCGAADKTFLPIHGANHNDLFMKGLDDYLKAVNKLVKSL
jgi:alpha-beta hydrolase superfamily lysophospholipase